MHKRQIGIAALLILALVLGGSYSTPWANTYSNNLSENLFSFGSNRAFAAGPVASVKSGNWSAPSTWSTGTTPISGDSVTISSGHTVTYDFADSKVAGVTVAANAKLQFAPTKSVLLRTNKNIVVLGELEMKPSSANVHHTIRFVDVNELNFAGGGMDVVDTDIGLWVRGNGVLDIAGTPKTSWTRLQGSALVASLVIILESAPVGWRVGDEISVVPTEPPSAGNASWNGFEERTIVAILGNIVVLNSPLFRSHPAAVDPVSGNRYTAEVLNLSRNVHIEGTGDGSADPANNGRAHVSIRSGVPQFVSHAEFKLLGPRHYGGRSTTGVLGRYPLHFHHSMNGSRGSLIEGVVVRHGGGHAFVPHASHGITFRDTIAYDTWDDAYWWDPPVQGPTGSGPDAIARHTSNNTNDVLYDRAVVAIAKFDPAFAANYTTGFMLGAGSGNEIRNSVAVGVQGATCSSCNANGFHWPSEANQNDGGNVWTFKQGNMAHNNQVHGIFTWQNDGNIHIVENFVAYHNGGSAVDHGAYGNNYQYKNMIAFGNGRYGLESHAAAPSKNIGRADGYTLAFENYKATEPVMFPKHNAAPSMPTLLKDCIFGGVVIDDASDSGQNPTKADFVNCTKPNGQSLEPGDFSLQDVRPGLEIRVQRPNGTAYRLTDGGAVTSIAPFYTISSTTPNQSPSVDAGPNQSATLNNSATVSLNGSVFDDGLPNHPGAVSTLWTVVSGPGPVTFGNASAVDTTATFTVAGDYVLRLSADDGELSSSDETSVTIVSTSSNPFLVSNLSVASGRNYQVVDNGLVSGALVYIDRSYTVTTAPAMVDGATYIQTANDDKSNSNAALLSFILGQDAAVYVAYDSRASSRPNWLSGWASNLGSVGTTDVSFDLFSKAFSAGSTVSLGGNQASGAAGAGSNYFVVVVPQGSPPPTPNQAPTVNAGPNQSVRLSSPATISLDGTVSDDGLPNPPGSVSTLWTAVSGPGPVAFGNAAAVDTTATFSVAGTYVLRLSADDGERSVSDDITVTALEPNQPPIVDAGVDQTVTLSSSATVALNGTVSDDGLPNSPGAVSTLWTVVSGPGPVNFGSAAAVDTTATFSVAGTYVLRLSADDGDLSASDDVTITVTQTSNTQPLTVSNLSVASGKAYQVVDNGFTTSAPIFIDRVYITTSVPGDVDGATHIQTANNDKAASQENFLSFSINRNATVYVAYDHRAGALPNWLSGWSALGSVGTTDVIYNLYAKDFASGSVHLGGNLAAGASGASSNYFVLLTAR